MERVYANVQKMMKSIIEEPETSHYYIIGPESTCLLFVDSILDTFNSLSNSNTDLFAPLVKRFADLRENLMFLESFFVSMEFLSNDNILRSDYYLLIYAVAVVDRAACVVYSSLVGETDAEMVERINSRFSDLNVNPDLSRALRSSTSLIPRERFSELDPTNGLLVLLDSLAGSAGSMDSPARKVFDELKSFSNFLTNLPTRLKNEKLDYLTMSIVSITSKALIIMNLRYREKVQATNDDVNGLLFNLVDEIRYVKMRARAREFKPYNTSMTNGLGFLDNFLGKLKELLRCGTEDIALKDQFRRVYVEFDNLRVFMSQNKDLIDVNEVLQGPWRHIVSLAYQAEYDIDLFLVKSVGDMYIMSSIATILEQIDLFKSELQAQHDKLTFVIGARIVVRTSHVSSKDELRYLIVVDDFWDVQAWDLLNRIALVTNNCSRIDITSRLTNVATLSNKVHNLRPLADADSWELLQQKLFGLERCPPELSHVGQQIAKSCKGLPLGVSVTSGLLSIMDNELDKWIEVAGSLNSLILSDQEVRCDILELSYQHLPDREIPVRQLKWLWMAEGFIQNLDSRCLDDVAEDYLMDLIGRSLIIPSKERSQGGVKTCHIHDLLRDFCLTKAEEDRLLSVICTEDFSYYSKVYDQLRLSISYDVSYVVQPNPDWCNIRSLLYTSQVASVTRDVSFVTINSLLLRVLDLGYVICESIEGIESLIHLRYLAVQARITTIPSSISNLWNLQTFLFTAEIGDSKDDIVKLKHIHTDYGATFCLRNGTRSNSFEQHTLETLSTPSLSFGEDTENLLRGLPNLRKLRCIYLDSFDDSEKCNRFPVLEFLHQLMSLKHVQHSRHEGARKCVSGKVLGGGVNPLDERLTGEEEEEEGGGGGEIW
ncbi:hypothetical protein Leryth_027460 [Lithospermum erythrorhizon]|nr:hypothetical protein Leryth_027460 [Lithospermum erythrorhizon]